jgi:hypothetical protein
MVVIIHGRAKAAAGAWSAAAAAAVHATHAVPVVARVVPAPPAWLRGEMRRSGTGAQRGSESVRRAGPVKSQVSAAPAAQQEGLHTAR